MATSRGTSRMQHEIAESPAAVTLSAALDEIERAALDTGLLTLKTSLEPHYAALVNEGGWFSSARFALDAFSDSDGSIRTTASNIESPRATVQRI